MAVKLFERPFDYTPGVTKKVVEGEPHTIPTSPPHDIYLHHIPREGTVVIPGYTEVDGTPGAGQFRVHYTEQSGAPRGRITFSEADAGKSVAVNYHACGTLIWAEDRGDGRPNIAEMQEVLERVQEAGGIDYSSSVAGFSPADVAAALDALAGVRIVEMGSNANGTYVRWENGLQVCYVRIGDFGPIDRPWGTLYVGPSEGRQWTFPAAFVSIPVVVAFAGSANSNAAIAYQDAAPISSNGVTLNLARGTASSLTDFVIAAIAIGAWK